jgi:hypothetical protein
MLKIIGDFYINLGNLLIKLGIILKNNKKLKIFLFLIFFTFIYVFIIFFIILFLILYYYLIFYFYKYKSSSNNKIYKIYLTENNLFENNYIYIFYVLFFKYPKIISFSFFYKTLKMKNKKSDKFKYFFSNLIIYFSKRLLTHIINLPISILNINIYLTDLFFDISKFNYKNYLILLENVILNIIIEINNQYSILTNFKVIIFDSKFNLNPFNKNVNEICSIFKDNDIKTCFIFLKNSTKNGRFLTHLGYNVKIKNNITNIFEPNAYITTTETSTQKF